MKEGDEREKKNIKKNIREIARNWRLQFTPDKLTVSTWQKVGGGGGPRAVLDNKARKGNIAPVDN
jgi:hypothetical protein